MSIRVAITDDEIRACYPVMAQLRPHVQADDFVPRVRRQEQQSYRLAGRWVGEKVVAVAGYRHGECLSQGRYIYVDDLVTDEPVRSSGVGHGILAYLEGLARARHCPSIELDSALERALAHRFYFREGYVISAFVFRKQLP